ncbi:MAG: 30S ribosomal protein S13 [Candidatus Sungbacteria bacterium]|uniref:Small ribosomal subunit protein uS13 n=1 Tax=Candidatus Sungiibacteriota bacterium TaxID=2750080 RepID=A0A931YDF6_9BACT|nr:30S ribosomal protein S13 [Candidatus Sungbacteria bacterium]
MRIAGINIPDNKRVEIALTYIFGVGLTLSQKILVATKIDPNKRAKDLTSDEANKVKEYIEKNFKIEGELKREITQNIKRKKDIGSYQGVRHMRGLPVRGQQTKTNNRTRRGNVRKTMGSGRKPTAQKT